MWCEKCPEGYWGAVSSTSGFFWFFCFPPSKRFLDKLTYALSVDTRYAYDTHTGPGGVIIQDGVMLLEDCVSCSDDYICSPSAEECTSCIDVPAPTVTASSDVRVSKATVGNLAHGGLMIFAWACLSPIGISFMKYGKHLPASTWFKAHKFLMPMAILFTIAGLATILAPGVKHSALAVNSKGKKNHAQYGFAVVALCVVQGLLGYFRNRISMYQAGDYDPDFPHGPKRYIFTGLHRTTGWVLCVLSLVNISKGIALFEEETPRLTAWMRWSSSAAAMVPRASPYQGDWDPVPAGSLFKAYCFVALGFVVILELVHVTKYQWSSGGPFSCSSKKTAYATFVAQGDMEMKFRNIALALFSAFSVSMTVALCVLLHYRMF